MDFVRHSAEICDGDPDAFAVRIAQHWQQAEAALIARSWSPGTILALMINAFSRAGMPLPVDTD